MADLAAKSAPRARQEGRLASPDMEPATDPRIDPRLLAALALCGADAAAEPPKVNRHDPRDLVVQAVAEMEAGIEELYDSPNQLPGDEDKAVTHAIETVPGVDGNEIRLHIYRPAEVDDVLPCIVYVHGGGMTMSRADNKVHRRWAEDLAATGSVAIGVDFRNAYTPDGLNPFPAGLNDCSSALTWIHANRERLGITKIVLQGESGGGNLVLATAIKAKRAGQLDSIDGVYATVPFISGAYDWDEEHKRQELPSLVENDGYFANCQALDLLVALYDPTASNSRNPLCWPYFAAEADLEGLPPHVISVNECDPLRDEGVAYYRKLAQAGVSVTGRVNLGLTHGADLIFRQAVSATYSATVADIKRFADSL